MDDKVMEVQSVCEVYEMGVGIIHIFLLKQAKVHKLLYQNIC